MELKTLKIVIISISLLLLFSISSSAQPVRIAFLPFQNMDGEMRLNIYSYQLQDSCLKAFKELDPEGQYYQIVPSDSIEYLLAEMNLDPTNPQYETDKWKAVQMLGADKVITGNFKMMAKKLLINAYVYDVRTKLPDPDHQARDIFKSEEKVLSAVSRIVRKLKKVFI